MKNVAKTLLITVALGATAAPAMADGFFYGGADLGQSKASDACKGALNCKDNAGAFRIAGGYQFVPMMGAEVSYGYYGKASMGTAGGAALGDWKATGFQVSGIGALPLGNGFSLTAKVGIAATTLNLSGTGHSTSSTNLAYGIGARFDFNRDVGVRLQYENLGDIGDSTTGPFKVTLITAGIVAKF